MKNFERKGGKWDEETKDNVNVLRAIQAIQHNSGITTVPSFDVFKGHRKNN